MQKTREIPIGPYSLADQKCDVYAKQNVKNISCTSYGRDIGKQPIEKMAEDGVSLLEARRDAMGTALSVLDGMVRHQRSVAQASGDAFFVPVVLAKDMTATATGQFLHNKLTESS